MATARNLITKAYQIAGIIGLGETPSAAEVVQGLDELNDIIFSLDGVGLWSYTRAEATGTLVAGQSEYTIGADVSADINAARPMRIDSLKILIGSTWSPIEQKSLETWDSSAVVTDNQGIPWRFRYVPDNPLGTIDFGAPAGVTYQFKVEYEHKISEYALGDTITLPPGYEGYLKYALAVALGNIDGYDVSAISATAERRLERIRVNNVQVGEMDITSPRKSGWYDYKSNRVL